MKITLLTSDKERHNYFINLLTKNCDKLYVVQEVSKKTNNKVPDNYINSKILENYFDKVNIAQKKIFGINNLSILNKKNVKIFNTIEEAVSKSNFIIATSNRKRFLSKKIYNNFNFLINKFNEYKNVSFLFGPENSGLSNQDLRLANIIFTIPTDKFKKSLNL